METRVISAHVWPHSGKGTHGPHDVTLGDRYQSGIICGWPHKGRALLSIEQPNDEDNFTIIRTLFLRPGTHKPGIITEKLRRVAVYRREPSGILRIRIKTRYTSNLPHPVPQGRYLGTINWEDEWAVLTIQAATHMKEPKPSEPKTIISPGDADYGSTLEAARKVLL